MTALTAAPFRVAPDARRLALGQFNRRTEIEWFGLHGSLEENGQGVVRFAALPKGAIGGGGSAAALNGGVIAAGFDAAVVLCCLGHYPTQTVVTLALSVQFLSLARLSPALAFHAWATRTTRQFAFLQAELRDGSAVHASATAMLKPIYEEAQ
ncbi:MAG: hypothetical protein KBC46_03910 [Ferrovibrio sp.]|jgi:acyl-coenzyme A thioesterase PaaI-like protein|nr:hypothetical protein [Ferrovibrio sp.]